MGIEEARNWASTNCQQNLPLTSLEQHRLDDPKSSEITHQNLKQFLSMIRIPKKFLRF